MLGRFSSRTTPSTTAVSSSAATASPSAACIFPSPARRPRKSVGTRHRAAIRLSGKPMPSSSSCPKKQARSPAPGPTAAQHVARELRAFLSSVLVPEADTGSALERLKRTLPSWLRSRSFIARPPTGK
jgi:hypothetical protein